MDLDAVDNFICSIKERGCLDTQWITTSRRVFIPVKIRGKMLRCGVDFMADVCLLSRKTWEHIGRPKLSTTDLNLEDAQRQGMKIFGSVKLPMTLIGRENELLLREFKFYVVNELVVPCILGRDWMENFEVKTSFSNTRSDIQVANETIILEDEVNDQPYPMVLKETLEIYPTMEIIINVLVPGAHENTTGLSEKVKELDEGLHLANTWSTIQDGSTPVRLCNPTNNTITLPEGSVIGTWINCTTPQVMALRRKPEADIFEAWVNREITDQINEDNGRDVPIESGPVGRES